MMKAGLPEQDTALVRTAFERLSPELQSDYNRKLLEDFRDMKPSQKSGSGGWPVIEYLRSAQQPLYTELADALAAVWSKGSKAQE